MKKIMYSGSRKSVRKHLEVWGEKSQKTPLGRKKGLGERETQLEKFPLVDVRTANSEA